MTRSKIKTAPLVVLLCICAATPLEAQLPFDITPEDVSAIDTTRVTWSNLRSWVGGLEAELDYRAPDTSLAECKAVALLGLVQLRDYYSRRRETPPVSIRLRLRCGAAYRGDLVYDGVVMRLDLVDRENGTLAYRGRHRGLP